MVELDDSELRAFAVDLTGAVDRVVREAPRAVKYGALQIKNQLVSEMRGSRSFKGIGGSISFDIIDGGFTAEIGPTSTPGSAGNLANIAYFGGSNGGGGTVPDPSGALEAEAPRFEKAIADMAEEV